MFQDQLPFRRAGPLLAAGLCFLAGAGCQSAKQSAMMGPVNFEEQMQTVAKEQNLVRDFDKRADKYRGFREDEYTNGVIYAKRVEEDYNLKKITFSKINRHLNKVRFKDKE